MHEPGFLMFSKGWKISQKCTAEQVVPSTAASKAAESPEIATAPTSVLLVACSRLEGSLDPAILSFSRHGNGR